MKRIKNRKKHFQITNPLGFSLFCAMIILVIGLIVGVIFLAKGGYIKQMLTCAKSELNGERAVPTQEAEASPSPELTEEPSIAPTESAEETPDVGTPVPETPTPPPLEPETPDPSATYDPKLDPNAPLAGVTIGLDPMRGGSKGKADGPYDLEFAKALGAYLESKGATVVITREDNNDMSTSKRAKIIKDADCDIALRLFCNHISSKTSGCFVEATKNNLDFAQILIDEYSAATGIPKQKGSNKKDGVEKVSNSDDQVSSKCGCPCVRIILGNWDNKTERANLQDEAFQQKMMEAIFEAFLKQLNPTE
jgi:N-acetylmuramoyl-L-alanine amidase